MFYELSIQPVIQEHLINQILLSCFWQKEKEINKEMRRKVDELEAKTSVLSIERAELKNKLMDSETTTTYLTNTQKELEAALVEKESHINQMKENAAASNPDQTTIKELLQQKEAEPELDKSENSSDSIPATAEDNSNSTTISESNHNDESIVVGANTENATSETVVLDKSENSSDSMSAPAEENSSNTNPSDSSHQDEGIVVEAKNVNATSDLVVLDKSENTNGSVPVAEEQNSYNTTTWESNQQDNSSSQEQFLKLTTNIEDVQLQENKGDANEQSDDAPEGSHSDKSELQQGNQKLIDNQEASKEESDGTRQVEDPKGEASNNSRETKLLEKENEKERNPEGTSSEDSLSEANQNKTQAVEPVVDPTDVNPSTSTNNEERRETNKRHRRRRSRSRRNRKATVEVDAAANP